MAALVVVARRALIVTVAVVEAAAELLLLSSLRLSSVQLSSSGLVLAGPVVLPSRATTRMATLALLATRRLSAARTTRCQAQRRPERSSRRVQECRQAAEQMPQALRALVELAFLASHSSATDQAAVLDQAELVQRPRPRASRVLVAAAVAASTRATQRLPVEPVAELALHQAADQSRSMSAVLAGLLASLAKTERTHQLRFQDLVVEAVARPRQRLEAMAERAASTARAVAAVERVRTGSQVAKVVTGRMGAWLW